MKLLSFVVGGTSSFLHLFSFASDTGSVYRHASFPANGNNPSFLIGTPSREGHRTLYAVLEGSERVAAYDVASADGPSLPAPDAPAFPDVSVTTVVSSTGKSPAHVALSPCGKFVTVANYHGGGCAVLAIDDINGKAGLNSRPVSVVDHGGRPLGPRNDRQDAPHPHQVYFVTPHIDRQHYTLLVPDLGTDSILQFVVDKKTGKLSPHPTRSFVALPPGTGPRNLVHRDGTAYVVGELSCTVLALDFDEDQGIIVGDASGNASIRQELSTIPENLDAKDVENIAAAIQLSHDGKFLYVSTRGVDIITVFGLRLGSDQKPGGFMHYLTSFHTGGNTPRFFTFHPSEEYLLVGNQDSNSITVFRRQADKCLKAGTEECSTPEYELVGSVQDIEGPQCILFL